MIYAIDSEGNVEWKYNTENEYIDSEPTIDKYGNLYFGKTSLTSLDYSGKLRWSIPINGVISSGLICDSENTIYVNDGSSNLRIIAINKDGKIIWTVTNPIQSNAGISPSIGFNKLYIPTNNWNDFFSIE